MFFCFQSPEYIQVKPKKKKKKHGLSTSQSSQLIGSNIPSKVNTPKDSNMFVSTANHSPLAGVIFTVTDIGQGQNNVKEASSVSSMMLSTDIDSGKTRPGSLDQENGYLSDAVGKPTTGKQPPQQIKKIPPKKRLEDLYNGKPPDVGHVLSYNGVEVNGHSKNISGMNGHVQEIGPKASSSVYNRKGNKSQKSLGKMNSFHMVNGKGTLSCDSGSSQSADSIISRSKKRNSLTGKWYQA